MPAKKEKKIKVTSRDIPRLLETLQCAGPLEQSATLTQLCPCRNVRYEQEIWRAIFAAREAEAPIVRDRAQHAIETLRERAKIDPRTQELLRDLIAEGICPDSFEAAIPTYRPNPYENLNGLFIPRFEHPRRSKINRRR